MRIRLDKPVDGASLAMFRIFFGFIMLWHIAKHFRVKGGMSKIEFFFVNPAFNFPYYGFEWVKPFPEPWMTTTFVVAGIAALLIGLGVFYRAAAATFFLTITYIFLCEQSKYNNHYYLMSLMAFLLIIMPADKRFSIAAWFKAKKKNTENTLVPFWTVFIIRFQVFVVYFYGGIAKINKDWLTGQPIISAGKKSRALLDQFHLVPDFITVDHVSLFMAWGGLVFDFTVGFLLLYKPTRWIGLVCAFIFNFHNIFIFPIGIFPYLAFAMCLIFLEPDWPQNFWRWLKEKKFKELKFKELISISKWVSFKSSPSQKEMPRENNHALSQPLFYFIVIWVAFQTLFPFRHNFIKGDANWTEEAQDFSWRMMLRMKSAGHNIFYVNDPQLWSRDEKGRPTVNWDSWEKDKPKSIYVPIIADKFDWSLHDGLTIVFEPLHGYRVIYNPTVEGLSLEDAKLKVEKLWQQTFKRTPRIFESLELVPAIDKMIEEIKAVGTKYDNESITAKNAITDLKMLNEKLPYVDKMNEYEKSDFLRFTIKLTRYLEESPLGPVVKPIINRLGPFALQSGLAPSSPLLIVYDDQMDFEKKSEGMSLLSNDQPYLIWLDISRMPNNEWKGLPQTFINFDRGELKVIWNHFKDLNHVQLKRSSVRPHMIYEYVRSRIAPAWEKMFNRTPQVFVLNLVMLNYKDPRPMISPTTDLVKAKFKPFRHDPWIQFLKDTEGLQPVQ
ncbi:MAG: HTTM domain-containing protein [Nitrospinales bacterium]